MKSLAELKDEQKAEVENLRAAAVRLVRDRLQPQERIIGVLLAGSVARGDARSGPYGLYIDIVVLAEGRNDVDLKELFGPSIEPGVPKHCVKVEDIAVAFELTTTKDLIEIRMKPEAEIYARQESIILYDKTGFLQRWKDTAFTITDEQRSKRALHWFFRYFYLVNNYRIEKWKHRSAWLQLCQNGNEAIECYCNFLFCINGWFIPRKDWLVYLTCELKNIAPGHELILEELYSTVADEQGQTQRFAKLWEIFKWMSAYCKENKWIDLPEPKV
jgi:predicted nucleotidyltransferase